MGNSTWNFISKVICSANCAYKFESLRNTLGCKSLQFDNDGKQNLTFIVQNIDVRAVNYTRFCVDTKRQFLCWMLPKYMLVFGWTNICNYANVLSTLAQHVMSWGRKDS